LPCAAAGEPAATSRTVTRGGAWPCTAKRIPTPTCCPRRAVSARGGAGGGRAWRARVAGAGGAGGAWEAPTEGVYSRDMGRGNSREGGGTRTPSALLSPCAASEGRGGEAGGDAGVAGGEAGGGAGGSRRASSTRPPGGPRIASMTCSDGRPRRRCPSTASMELPMRTCPVLSAGPPGRREVMTCEPSRACVNLTPIPTFPPGVSALAEPAAARRRTMTTRSPPLEAASPPFEASSRAAPGARVSGLPLAAAPGRSSAASCANRERQ
jgi:hypothetical protein